MSDVDDPIRDALYHAKARFECLADDFEKSGDTVQWAMCSVDAERMDRALKSHAENTVLAGLERSALPSGNGN